MVKNIVLTLTAQSDLENISDYIFEKFGAIVCNQFLTRFETACDIIANTPTMYPLLNKKGKIRKCVLTKHSIIYFRVHENNVEIITIFDTRQNPENLKNII